MEENLIWATARILALHERSLCRRLAFRIREPVMLHNGKLATLFPDFLGSPAIHH
jgi:hypothetical protein